MAILKARRLVALISIITGPLVIYFALPSAVALGWLTTILTTFLITTLIITGIFFGFELPRRLWLQLVAMSGGTELTVGLIFLTPLSLELKLLIVNIMLVTVVITRLYNAKRNRKTFNSDRAVGLD